MDVCPTGAYTWIEQDGKQYLQLSHAKCVFCGICEEMCSYKAIAITNNFELAATHKEGLLVKAGFDTKESVEALGKKLNEKIFSVFKHSLHVREVDVGSCNGCEWEVVALYNSPVHDLQRFGIDVVASPRHADCLLVTGPHEKSGNCSYKNVSCYARTKDSYCLGCLCEQWRYF
ncbi:MAG: 4Fe-4S binding protein [Candidatus Jettenia sp.]|nr:MAG: 4Fe-4S binding protein [Candidatus Jettenia sp.]